MDVGFQRRFIIGYQLIKIYASCLNKTYKNIFNPIILNKCYGECSVMVAFTTVAREEWVQFPPFALKLFPKKFKQKAWAFTKKRKNRRKKWKQLKDLEILKEKKQN